MKDPRPQLLAEIARYLARKNKTESWLGRQVAKNSSLIQRIRSGGPILLDQLLKVDAYMKTNR